MSNVIWKYPLEPVDREVIREVEEKLGVVFPDDYVQCAMQYHGAIPKPSSFELNGSFEAVNDLLSFDVNNGYHILRAYSMIQDRLVDGVYPFAEDSFGNYICFDYRGQSAPTVVFWEHEIASYDPEKAIITLCGSFTEFVNRLREFEEEE